MRGGLRRCARSRLVLWRRKLCDSSSGPRAPYLTDEEGFNRPGFKKIVHRWEWTQWKVAETGWSLVTIIRVFTDDLGKFEFKENRLSQTNAETYLGLVQKVYKYWHKKKPKSICQSMHRRIPTFFSWSIDRSGKTRGMFCNIVQIILVRSRETSAHRTFCSWLAREVPSTCRYGVWCSVWAIGNLNVRG